MGLRQLTLFGIPVRSLGKAHKPVPVTAQLPIQAALIVHNRQRRLSPPYTGADGEAFGFDFGLRAVVFDYGMVLTGPPDPKAYAELLRITGLNSTRLDSFYWADRHAYDEGSSLASPFGRRSSGDAGLDLTQVGP